MSRSIPITLDRERRLHFTFNALSRLQEQQGKRINELLGAGTLGFADIRALVWAGLIVDDPTLTLDGAGDAIQSFLEQGHRLDALMDRLLDALNVSGLVPKADAEHPETGTPLASPPSASEPSGLPSETSA